MDTHSQKYQFPIPDQSDGNSQSPESWDLVLKGHSLFSLPIFTVLVQQPNRAFLNTWLEGALYLFIKRGGVRKWMASSVQTLRLCCVTWGTLLSFSGPASSFVTPPWIR